MRLLDRWVTIFGRGVAAFGAAQKVALFRDARSSARCLLECFTGLGVASRHFDQVAAHRVQPVVGRNAPVVGERREQLQPGSRPVHHGYSQSAVERRHRVRRNAVEHLVEGEDSAANRSRQR